MKLQALPDLTTLRVGGAAVSADIAQIITSIDVSYAVGQVAELAITGADNGGRLASSSLAQLGMPVTYAGMSWEVGSFDCEFVGGGLVWTFRCRSKVARTMRRTYSVRADRAVSASAWVSSRVAAAGGTTVAETSSTKPTISQSGGTNRQSELDVIGTLASDLQFSWVEYGGTFYFANPRWVYDGNAGTNTWPVTWLKNPATDALSLTLSESDDDKTNLGTGNLTVPQDLGILIRPWDRIQFSNVGQFESMWLVESVSGRLDGVAAFTVSLVIPRIPIPKAGSVATKKLVQSWTTS